MQYFYIKRGATLPTLRVELVLDGRYDFMKSYQFNNAIQNADVFFSLRDEHNVLKISKAPCNIVVSEESSCEEKYILEYEWKEKDTRKPGVYKGTFEIVFFKDLTEEGQIYQNGKLIGPIYEELIIEVL